MKKIPTIFVRDLSKQPAIVTSEWKAGCEWVRDGEGVATLKHDGTCCLVRDGTLYKRREFKEGQPEPAYFEHVNYDEETGKYVGWVPVGDGPDDKYHREAFASGGFLDGTFELMGPKVQGNHEGYASHILMPHGKIELEAPRTFEELKLFLTERHIEGIVWHHPDGRAAKIKRRDFGLKW